MLGISLFILILFYLYLYVGKPQCRNNLSISLRNYYHGRELRIMVLHGFFRLSNIYSEFVISVGLYIVDLFIFLNYFYRHYI